jgi:stage II sporulation protein GA (sporulation sigma-E factor processing peptidase)
MMFSNSINQKTTRLLIKLEDKSLEVDALIDTGNLVKDPMNMNPVIFLKRSCAENIIPSAIIDLTDVDSLSSDYRKRIRLIPVTRKDQTHVMTGIRVDKVVVFNNRKREEINATIAIDKEDGTYGGYHALAPYVAVCNDA